MFPFLLALGGTIVCTHIYYTSLNEISRLTTGLLSLLCLLLCLIYAPWFIKAVAVIALVFVFPGDRRKTL